jgi:hypothetical protein
MNYNEEILQSAWKFGFFDRENLKTVDGEKIEVISVGLKNHNSGPDFFAARIKSNGYIWAGNVEMHIKASDWYKHGHHKDKAYKNVILHIVAEFDIDKDKYPDYNLKTVVLPIDKKLLTKYEELKNNSGFIACQSYVKNVHPFVKSHMIHRLVIERLAKKSEYIITLYQNLGQDWNETFYIVTARYFGTPHNSDNFEMLAKSLPQKILAKHKNNLLQLEALLFGVAGFLNNQPVKDSYITKLKDEWQFLSKKYDLVSKSINWRFMRMRPANFPTIRIAQFAKLIHNSSFLFSKILSTENIYSVRPLFELNISGYWENHYTFGKKSIKRSKHTGKTFIDVLLINVVVPFLFSYGELNNNESYKEKALTWLDLIDAENNKITREFEKLEFPIKSALFSQGLLTLKQEYCDKHRCLNCLIGNNILKPVEK